MRNSLLRDFIWFKFLCSLLHCRLQRKVKITDECFAFEDFCLSLSWKYRFSQNVSRAGVQSRTNRFCEFHFDLTGRRLSGSRFKKLGVVPKKLYRNTLKLCSFALFVLFAAFKSINKCLVLSY